MPFFRSDMAAIHVNLTSVPLLDKEPWDMMEGGDPVAEEVTIFPGGMVPQVALGGIPKWTPVIVERTWSEVLGNVFKEIVGAAGNSAMEVSFNQFGANKLPTGKVYAYTGVLTGVERPKYKASESVQAMLKLTMSVNGAVS